jgi:hypothetical protein
MASMSSFSRRIARYTFVAALLKANLEAFCHELNLTISVKEYGSLLNHFLSRPGCPTNARAFFTLFSWREMSRLAPDRLQLLDNHHTRKVTVDEMLMGGHDEKRVFPGNDRVIEMSAQWEKIICFPAADGTFLSAPSQLLWSVKLHHARSGRT